MEEAMNPHFDYLLDAEMVLFKIKKVCQNELFDTPKKIINKPTI